MRGLGLSRSVWSRSVWSRRSGSGVIESGNSRLRSIGAFRFVLYRFFWLVCVGRFERVFVGFSF